jgi:hypothetical protein
MEAVDFEKAELIDCLQRTRTSWISARVALKLPTLRIQQAEGQISASLPTGA